MSRIKELFGEREGVASEIVRLRSLHDDEQHEWSDENESAWKSANSDYDALSKSIEMEERAQQVERETNERANQLDKALRGGGGLAEHEQNEERRLTGRTRGDRHHLIRSDRRRQYEERCAALQGWMLGSCQLEMEDRHQVAMRSQGVKIGQDFHFQLRSDTPYEMLRRELRASTAATEGGETIREDFSGSFEIALLAHGAMRNVAEVIRTAKGGAMPWPTIDDTSNVGQIKAEEAAADTTDIVTSEVTFNSYKYSSDAVLVSSELLRDSEFNLANIIGNLLGTRIARKTNADFTTGDGSAKPNGIVTASTLGKTTASTTAITFDELIDLQHSVDPAYRPAASFMLHDLVLAAIRKLKDGNGVYIWEPSAQLGVPDRLMGYPLQINQDMSATITATDITVLFGDFSKYKIREIGTIRFRRLQELYAATDQEGFMAWWSGDGDLVDAGTNPVKHLIQAAS